jgi:hypothetical protein
MAAHEQGSRTVRNNQTPQHFRLPVQERTCIGECRIIDDQPDVKVSRCLADAFDRAARRKIHRQRQGIDVMGSLRFLGKLAQRIFAPGDENQVESPFCQGQAECASDPFGSAGDHGLGTVFFIE